LRRISGMKIKVIYPTRLGPAGKPVKTKARHGRAVNLSMIYLAGITPKEHEVEVIDDLFEDPDYDEPVDLVGLSAMTMQAPRAYQIAKEYRKRGVKVVMGGFHASFMPNEAGENVDAVVIGEAELSWPQLLRDAEKGQLKRIYQSPRLENLQGLPPPRYDLIAQKPYKYSFYPLWVGRGCPHHCKFCSVTNLYGRQLRTRPLQDVEHDASLVANQRIFIVDDNLFAYGKFLYELFPILARYKLKWTAQADPRFADDDFLLDLARETGMEAAYIGFENFYPDRLQSMDKEWARIENYGRLIEKIHRRGIAVQASMIFGITRESKQSIRETLKCLEDWQVDGLALYIFTPVPGCELYDEFLKNGTNLPKDWSAYDGNHAVYVPEGMTREELEELYWELYSSFFSYPSIIKRFARVPYGPKMWARYLAGSVLVNHVDMRLRRSVFDNYVSFRELIPGYSALK